MATAHIIENNEARQPEPEVWKPCPGFEEIYHVSSYGRVKRVVAGAGRAKIGGILRPGKNPKGYLAVCLCRDGKCKTKFLHVLVCETFYGPKPTPSHQAAHRDDDKEHNRLSNLYWATPLENHRDRRRNGGILVGSKIGRSTLTEGDVREIRRLRGAGMKCRDVGAQFGIAGHTVSRIANGLRWGHLS